MDGKVWRLKYERVKGDGLKLSERHCLPCLGTVISLLAFIECRLRNSMVCSSLMPFYSSLFIGISVGDVPLAALINDRDVPTLVRQG